MSKTKQFMGNDTVDATDRQEYENLHPESVDEFMDLKTKTLALYKAEAHRFIDRLDDQFMIISPVVNGNDLDINQMFALFGDTYAIISALASLLIAKDKLFEGLVHNMDEDSLNELLEGLRGRK